MSRTSIDKKVRITITIPEKLLLEIKKKHGKNISKYVSGVLEESADIERCERLRKMLRELPKIKSDESILTTIRRSREEG